jgi:hypothetical protein
MTGGFIYKDELVNEAAKRILKDRTNLTNIYLEQFYLFGDRFTMNELQRLYETILGVTYRRTSFQRMILNLHILKQVDIKRTGAAHKAPYLYTFKKEK